MQYRWGDFSLDRAGALLTRQGDQVDVSRKVLDCISHLIEHRDRVVGYDELSRRVWGHDNVTHHQLSQVILAARRVLGDDGQAQRLIRTMPGLGYRWVGLLCEIADTGATPQEQAPDRPAPTQVDAAEPLPEASPPLQAQAAAPISPPQVTDTAWLRSDTLRAVAALALTLVAVAAIGWQLRKAEPTAATAQPAAAIAAEPLARLEEAFWRGKYEEVREGLATLPPAVADSPAARLLDIRLDIDRGRFNRAAQKLALQQASARAADDPVWQASLLATQSFLNGSAGRPGAEVLGPAQSAVKLLESTGHAASPEAMGGALSARGYGLMKTGRLESAAHDLVRARTLLLKAGDTHGALDAADTLARVQMRMGRLTDALALMMEIADDCRQSKKPVQEIYARNAATKIQVELLRWDEALASSDRSMALLREVPDSERRTRVVQLRALVLTGIGRLREAGSLIEEGQAMRDDRYSMIVPAAFHLASGHAERALAAAAEAAAFSRYDTNDTLNLESKEGALLLWMIAAQDLAANGKAMPIPSTAQLDALLQPESDIGHIALGRWLWAQGRSQDAETQFRLALAQSRQRGHLLTMLRCSEALIELLLQRGDRAAAEQVLAKLRAHDPERLDRDYRANLLGLRVALARGQRPAIEAAYRRTAALAGERTLPAQVLVAYRASRPSLADRKHREHTASRF